MLNTKLPRLVLASGNPGKIKEIQALLSDFTIVPQSVFNVPECDEPACTFVENALLKARHAALHSQLPALADDSGLIVDALNGAPGVISARYAGVGASDQSNVDKLLAQMTDIPANQRHARFICIMVLVEHPNDPCPLIAQGVWEGIIADCAIGDQGFGYDPVFWMPERHCTSAELSAELKNQLSHRGQALKQLVALIKNKKR